MSWMGWFRWMKHQVNQVGRQPPHRRPAPAVHRSMHRLEALLEQGAGRQNYRQRPAMRDVSASLVQPDHPAPAAAVPAWATAAIASHFEARPEDKPNRQVPTQLIIIALDASSQPVRRYTGTAHLTSTIPAAPAGDYMFTAEDAGRHRFSVTISTTGRPDIAVTDPAAPAASDFATGPAG